MSKTPQRMYGSGLSILAIVASAVLFSCKMPADGMPTYNTYWALNVVSADGSAHWTLTDEGSGGLLGDSSVIFTRGNGLFKVNYDGSNLTQLYPGFRWGDHSISPDGKNILLASGFFENNGYVVELYRMDLNGTNLVKLGPPRGWYAWTRISPNLDEILFYRDGGIATINTDGTNFRYVRTKTDSTSGKFGFYVDETHILYFESINAGYTTTLRLFNKTTQEDKLIGISSAGYPSFGRAAVGPNVLLAGVDGIRIFNIYTWTFQTVGRGFYASFSTDGSKIVGSDGKAIFTMNADGSNAHTIYSNTDATQAIVYPQYSPDGRNIVFGTVWSVQ